MTWEEQTASLKEFLASDECAEMHKEFDAWIENDNRIFGLELEASNSVKSNGSTKDAFIVEALSGNYDVAAAIAVYAGLAIDIEKAYKFIVACSNNEVRAHVCKDASLMAWCQDTFEA